MSKSILVAFKSGGIIPADITGGKEKRVGPHEPVEVPAAYGKHLIDDRFAYAAEAPAKAGKGKGARQDGAPRAAELAANIADLKKSIEATTDLDASAKLAADLAKAEDELKALETA